MLCISRPLGYSELPVFSKTTHFFPHSRPFFPGHKFTSVHHNQYNVVSACLNHVSSFSNALYN